MAHSLAGRDALLSTDRGVQCCRAHGFRVAQYHSASLSEHRFRRPAAILLFRRSMMSSSLI